MQKQWLGGNTEGKKPGNYKCKSNGSWRKTKMKKPGYYKRKNNARKQQI